MAVRDNEGEIRGGKWRDENTNGLWDGGEQGLEGWKIYVDINTNDQWDAGEPFDISDPNGAYGLVLEAGRYRVLEAPRPYWRQTYPTAGGGGPAYSNSLIQLDNCFFPNVLNFHFTNAPSPSGNGSLTVHAIADLSPDSPNEYLSLNAEGVLVTNIFVTDGLQMVSVTTTVTLTQADLQSLAFDGTVSVTVIPSSGVNNLSGTEQLRLTLAYPTAAGNHVVDLAPGQVVTNIDFGNVATGVVLNVSIPAAATEGDGALTGRVSVAVTPTTNLTVNLSSDNPSEVMVSNTTTIAAGQTNATFELTIQDDAGLDGRQCAMITASATGYLGGNAAICVEDNETATLGVLLPAAATEGDGVVTGQVTVSMAVSADVVVSLGSDDPSEVTVPSSVVVATGQSNAWFDVTVVDDGEIDGPQAACVTAHVDNWTNGAGCMSVTDNEHTNLIVSLPAWAMEGDGVLPDAGRVSISGTRPQALVVSLFSDDTTEVTVTSMVTIAAGATSVTFDIQVENDAIFDGVQTALVSAVAAGFSQGNAAIEVFDNDVDHFTFSAIPSPKTNGVPFGISLAARDAGGAVIPTYVGSVGLSATGDEGAVPVDPSTAGPFVGGLWSGAAMIGGVSSNVVLLADGGEGHTGTSNPFDVLPYLNLFYPPCASFASPWIADRLVLDTSRTLTGPSTINMSGCCVMPSTGELLVVLNYRGASVPPGIQVYNPDGTYLRDIDLVGFDDTEGICPYRPESNLFAVVEEGRNDITIVTIDATTSNINKTAGFTFHMGLSLPDPNVGIEGISYDRARDCFYAVKEKTPMAAYVVSNYLDEVSVWPLFDAEAALAGYCTDLSDLVYSPCSDRFLILSDESAKLMECDRDGNVISFAAITASQPEGVAFSEDRSEVYVVGEPNQYRIYTLAPLTGSAHEGDEFTAEVRLNWAYAQPVSVDFEVDSDTAVAGVDYWPDTGSVTFASGVTTAVVRISMLPDGEPEDPELIRISLVHAVNAELGIDRNRECAILDPLPPPAPYDPSPPHLSEGNPLDVDLSWSFGTNDSQELTVNGGFETGDPEGYVGPAQFDLDAVSVVASRSVGTNVVFEVYFGTNSVPSGSDLLGTTSNTTWDLPLLDAAVTYYWEITAKGSGFESAGPIWQFLTAGELDHFAWSPISSPQLVSNAIPVIIAAQDSGGHTIPQFTGIVDIRGYTSGIPAILHADFEDGLDGFTVDNGYGLGSGLWHLSNGRGGDSGHSHSNSFYYGQGEGPSGGGDYNAGATEGVLTSTSIDLSTVEPPVTLSFKYLLETEWNPAFDLATVEISTNGSPFGVIAGNKTGAIPLADPTSGTWATASLDLSAYVGTAVRIRFHFNTVDNTANSQEGWYVDDLVVASGADLVPLSPDASGNFVNGIWTGTVTVLDVVSNLYLVADDGAGHSGASAVFSVLAQLPSAPPSGVDLLPVSDTGISSSDNLTHLDNSTAGMELQFQVLGTVAGATVMVVADGNEIGNAVAAGSTTVVTTDGAHDLADGSRAITARQTEPDKTESTDSPTLNITIDTIPPAIPSTPDLQAVSDTGISNTDNITRDNTPTFNVSALPYFRFYRGVALISGNYESGTNYTPTTQADGAWLYRVASVDAAGNASAPSATLGVTIDTASPTVAGVVPAADSALSASNVNIDVTFSEDMTGVDGADLILGGSASGSAAVGAPTNIVGNTWRFPVTGLANGMLDIDLAPDPDDIEDPAGNDLDPSPTEWAYIVWISPAPPWVVAHAATNITLSSATLRGEVLATGGDDPAVNVHWGGSVGACTNVISMGQLGAATFSTNLPGLSQRTTYFYRCYATNVFGEAWSAYTNFTTFGFDPIHYVAPDGSNVWPFTTWATAATNIQDAVDVADDGDEVLVHDGTYRIASQVAVGKAITVRSVNGPAVATVDGGGATRCFDLSHPAAVIKGFRVTRGRADYGAGVRCTGGGVVEDCIFADNRATSGGAGIRFTGGGIVRDSIFSSNTCDVTGGGIEIRQSGALVENCLIVSNSAAVSGGGLYCEGGTVRNCTIADNASAQGGGLTTAASGMIQNSIIYGNLSGGNWYQNGSDFLFTYCCTTPSPGGSGNITTAPQFENGYHHAQDSAGIDDGTAADAPAADLDGIPRPLDGDNDSIALFDMGAYEFVHATADSDGDRQSDRDELVAGTDPTSDQDYLRINIDAGSQGSNRAVIVWWDSIVERLYTLRNTTNLMGIWSNVDGRVDLPGTDAIISHTNAQPGRREFYDLKVRQVE